MLKAINYQCVYDFEADRYPYTAFDQTGQLHGFQNLPVRNFEYGEWVDSVTGEPGELILFSTWDTSLKTTAEQDDVRKRFTKRKQDKFHGG